jgi:RHS repeat-associated protein
MISAPYVVAEPKITSYIRANSQLVAKIDENSKVKYYHNDFVLNVRGVTDKTGTLVGMTDYFPFGKYVFDISKSDNEAKFKGEVLDEATDYYKLGKSDFYDYRTGRFVIPSGTGNDLLPNSFNKYSYMMNNPFRKLTVKLFEGKGINEEAPSPVIAKPVLTGSDVSTISYTATPKLPELNILVFIFTPKMVEPINPVVVPTPPKPAYTHGINLPLPKPPLEATSTPIQPYKVQAHTLYQALQELGASVKAKEGLGGFNEKLYDPRSFIPMLKDNGWSMVIMRGGKAIPVGFNTMADRFKDVWKTGEASFTTSEPFYGENLENRFMAGDVAKIFNQNNVEIMEITFVSGDLYHGTFTGKTSPYIP